MRFQCLRTNRIRTSTWIKTLLPEKLLEVHKTSPARLVPAPKRALTAFVVGIEGGITNVLPVHLLVFLFALELIGPALVVVFNHKNEQGLISRGDV